MTEPDKPAPKRPRKGGRKPKLDPELVAAALAELMGNISAVARKFAVHRSSVQELIDKRPSLQLVVRDAREAMIDNAESSLARAVIGGEAWAVCFTLKTQGKSRGYVEKQIIENQGGQRLVIEEEVVDNASGGDTAHDSTEPGTA